MPTINPDIPLWARETVGLSIEDAAVAPHLGGARICGPDALKALERVTTHRFLGFSRNGTACSGAVVMIALGRTGLLSASSTKND
ncbi:hypothetical protein LJR230_004191 [Trinickia sp. LjRoot230]|uniref:hypothetical protein n=1 Tax=Trinickia sp. LjRoot230 TaxID=3342288 RepID=UPI003ECE59BF